MAEVRNIPECGANFSDTLSACDACKIIKSTQQEHRKILRRTLSSEHIKLVSTDLLGYADMAKYTDHHSRVKRGSFIEEARSVQPTADSATSQVRARQLALQCQGSPKQQFDNVSQYISRALRISEWPKQTVRYLLWYPTPTRNLWPHHKRKNANLQRPLLEDQRFQRGELFQSFNTLKSQLQLRFARPHLTIATAL